MFDCKQGFHTLDPKGRNFDNDALNKVARTLTAIANTGSNHTGYIAIGIADSEGDASKIVKLDGVKHVNYRKFHVVGIEREAAIRNESLNDYWTWIVRKLSTNPDLPEDFGREIGRNARIISYGGLAVGLLRINPSPQPVFFDGKIFERIGSDTKEVPQSDYMRIFSRFTGK